MKAFVVRLLFAATTSIVYASPALSADAGFDVLQINNKTCALVIAGSLNKDVVWVGQKVYDHCHVKVDTKEFSQKYSYCALSGILGSDKVSVTCQFGYHDKDNASVYFASRSDNLCQFICVRR